MLLSFGKYKCLHTGHGNLDVDYKMGDNVPFTTVKKKKLGVTIRTNKIIQKLRHYNYEERLQKVV